MLGAQVPVWSHQTHLVLAFQNGWEPACCRAGGQQVPTQATASLLSPLLLNFKLEFHLPFKGVVGVVKGHVFCQDLAHYVHFCVPGDVEKLCSHQRVAVVGLKPECGKGRVRNLLLSAWVSGSCPRAAPAGPAACPGAPWVSARPEMRTGLVDGQQMFHIKVHLMKVKNTTGECKGLRGNAFKWTCSYLNGLGGCWKLKQLDLIFIFCVKTMCFQVFRRRWVWETAKH